MTIEIIVLTRMFWQKIDLRPVQFPAGQTEKNKGSIIIITQHIIVVLTHASAKLYTFQSFFMRNRLQVHLFNGSPKLSNWFPLKNLNLSIGVDGAILRLIMINT